MPHPKLLLVALLGTVIITTGNAQPLDPEDAIIGLWAPNWAAAIEDAPVGLGGVVDESTMMYIGMAMELGAVRIGDNGKLTVGRAPSDRDLSILISTNEDGGLLLLPNWLEQPFPIAVRFEEPDTLIATRAAQDPRIPFTIEFTFHRMFEHEAIEAGNQDPSTNELIQGRWIVDTGKLESSALAEAFHDLEMRSQVLKHVSSNRLHNFSIEDQTVAFIDEPGGPARYPVPYEIVISTDDAALLLVSTENSEDLTPQWWRLDVEGQDRLTLWRDGLRVPLIRTPDGSDDE